jgi:hypothetical protein
MIKMNTSWLSKNCHKRFRLFPNHFRENDNAQQHGNAHCSLKIGEELDRPTKSALYDSKTDLGSDRNQKDHPTLVHEVHSSFDGNQYSETRHHQSDITV